jgi:Peptidase A4 family
MDADKPFEKRFPFKLVPTNLPGAYAVPPPPAGFDLVKATSAQLRKHGFPFSRPAARAHPAAVAAWKRATSRKWRVEDWIIPELEPVPGKTHHLRDRPNDNGVSPFWSGAVVTGPNGNFNGVLAFWNVPTISQPTEAQGERGGWDSSSWAGIDGWTSNDLLQAGVQQTIPGPGAKPQYTAWYQWWIAPPPHNPGLGLVDSNGYPVSWLAKYPYIYQTNYKNFPVAPGNQVMTAIVYRENAAGTVQFSNITTGQTSILNLKPPPTVQFAANNAEWIMELPNGGWPNTSLPKFSQIQFGDAFATIPNCPSAGLPGNGLILNMLVNGIQVTTASANDTEVTIDFTG